jgi:hypothetical protein
MQKNGHLVDISSEAPASHPFVASRVWSVTRSFAKKETAPHGRRFAMENEVGGPKTKTPPGRAAVVF